MKIETVEVSKLIPHPKNPRINLKKGMDVYDKLYRSLKDFDYIDPIIWNKRTGYVVSGHQRLQVMKDIAKENGTELKEVQVSVIDVDEGKQDALMIAVNRIGSKWDMEKLSVLMKELEDSDFETGFDDFDIDRMINEDDDTEEVAVSQYSYFSKETIEKQLSEEMIPLKREDAIEWTMTVAMAKWQFNQLCDGANVGDDISLLFTPSRIDVLIESYGTEEFNDKVVGQLIDSGLPRSVKGLPRMLWDKCGGTDYERDFPPYVARDIYKFYDCEGKHVVDVNGRWGGRLIGLASCLFKDVKATIKADATYDGLVGLKEFLRLGDNYTITKRKIKGIGDFALTEVRCEEDVDEILESLKDGGIAVVRVDEDDDFESYFETKCQFKRMYDLDYSRFKFYELRK